MNVSRYEQLTGPEEPNIYVTKEQAEANIAKALAEAEQRAQAQKDGQGGDTQTQGGA